MKNNMLFVVVVDAAVDLDVVADAVIYFTINARDAVKTPSCI